MAKDKPARAKEKGESRPLSRAQRRRRGWLLGGSALVVAAAVVGYFAYRAVADLPGEKVPSQGNAHIARGEDPHPPYNTDPPTSGPHLPYLAPWGVHTEPIPKELQVHNLEDGGVLVQYHCPTPCPDLVDKLKAIAGRYQRQVILAPYPGMKHRIALTAWTRIEQFDDFEEARIVRFITAYRGIDHHR